MNTLKGWITTIFLAATLMLSTIPANAGVIIGGRTDQPCSGPVKVDTKDDLGGVIIGGLVGVIIGGFTGVIIGGVLDVPVVNCGVIIGG